MTTETARRNRGGRPAVGPQVNIAIQPDILARVDEAARAAHVSRSEWIRRAIVGALHQPKPDAGQAAFTWSNERRHPGV